MEWNERIIKQLKRQQRQDAKTKQKKKRKGKQYQGLVQRCKPGYFPIPVYDVSKEGKPELLGYYELPLDAKKGRNKHDNI